MTLNLSIARVQRLLAEDEWPRWSIDAGTQEGFGQSVDPSLFELPGPQDLVCMGIMP